MNSQVYPLPQRSETDLSLTGRGDMDFSLATREPAQPMGRMLVESGRLAPEDVQRILDYQTRAGLPFGAAGVALGLLVDDDGHQVHAAQ